MNKSKPSEVHYLLVENKFIINAKKAYYICVKLLEEITFN